MFPTLGRIAAAVALLVATVAIATVATNSTAGAANTNVTARTDSLTDNGDGSLTVTYSPVVAPQTVALNLFAPGTTCDPAASPVNRLFGISNFSSTGLPVLAASPAVLSAGSPMRSGWANTTAASTLVAGSYHACLYYFDGASNALVQSLPVTIGTVTPTTVTPTTVTPTTTPSGDPVAPAFAG